MGTGRIALAAGGGATAAGLLFGLFEFMEWKMPDPLAVTLACILVVGVLVALGVVTWDLGGWYWGHRPRWGRPVLADMSPEDRAALRELATNEVRDSAPPAGPTYTEMQLESQVIGLRQEIAELVRERDAPSQQKSEEPSFEATVDLRCVVAEVDLGGLFAPFERYIDVTIDIANYSYVEAELTDIRGKISIAGTYCSSSPTLLGYHRRLPGDGPVRDKYGGAIWHPQFRQPIAGDHAAWVIHQMELGAGEVALTLVDVTLVGIAGSGLWERALEMEELILRGPLSDKAHGRFVRGNIFSSLPLGRDDRPLGG